MNRARAPFYRIVFVLAGIYNLGFGLWAGLRPLSFFRLLDLPLPNYPSIWACLGMVVGVYGLLYLYAAWDLDQSRPIIAIGLLGKLLGPIGWIITVHAGELPFRSLPLIVFNDLLWWIPFTLFLIDETAMARVIRRAAPFVCAAMHVVAALGTVLWLRQGSEAGGDAAARVAYISAEPLRWRVGWALWMLAAFSLLGLYAWWGAGLRRRSAALIAFVIGIAGLLFDLATEALFIAWLPRDFMTLFTTGALLSAGVANGLYTVAGIILTLAATEIRGWPRRLSWAVWGAGSSLTLFTFLQMPSAVIASVVALTTLVPIWSAVLGWRLQSLRGNLDQIPGSP